MIHLGEKVSVLVDGQLPPEAIERAHAHLARCRECRDQVEIERLLKARLTQLSAPPPAPDLVGRLLALGGPSGPLPPRSGHVPGSPRPRQLAPPAVTGTRTTAGRLARPTRSMMVSGSGRGVGARVGVARPATYVAGNSRPAGRPVPGPRRVRLAGAVLGALGVVGAGVTGLVLASPKAPPSTTTVPLDSFVVQFPFLTRSPIVADVSVERWQKGPLGAAQTVDQPAGRP